VTWWHFHRNHLAATEQSRGEPVSLDKAHSLLRLMKRNTATGIVLPVVGTDLKIVEGMPHPGTCSFAKNVYSDGLRWALYPRSAKEILTVTGWKNNRQNLRIKSNASYYS
jgi:hypothetical protein